MASLKEYRNNELKWFLLANILLMLITTNVFQFDVLEDNFGTYISEGLNIAAISSSAYILTFIFDSIIPMTVCPQSTAELSGVLFQISFALEIFPIIK